MSLDAMLPRRSNASIIDRSMKEGPDIAQIGVAHRRSSARQHADRADGRPGADGDRASQAAGGITLQTASSHLSKLEAGGLRPSASRGGTAILRSPDDEVGLLLESMMGFAANRGILRQRPRPEGSGAAQGAHLLQPSRRRFRGADAGPYGRRRARRDRGRWRQLTTKRRRTHAAARHRYRMRCTAQRRPRLPHPAWTGASGARTMAGSLGEALLSRFIDEKAGQRRSDESRAVPFHPERRARNSATCFSDRE